MFNIDAEFIEQLKDDGYDLRTIAHWEAWLRQLPRKAAAVQQIHDAFDNVKLGEGIGLHEANGMDDYATDGELLRLRKLDERDDWRKLNAELLDQYHATPCFFDSCGFVFHLPAFLLAELNDEYEYGFIDRIIEKYPPSGSWIDLLTPQQAGALVLVLSLVKQHPDYYHDVKKFDRAIDRFNRIATANGR